MYDNRGTADGRVYAGGAIVGGCSVLGPQTWLGCCASLCLIVRCRCRAAVLCPSVTFRVYDVDNDGFISNADLYHVLKAMVRGCDRQPKPP